MSNKSMIFAKGFVFVFLASLLLLFIGTVDDNAHSANAKDDNKSIARQVEIVKGQIKTNYDITGRPVNQAEDAKGRHRVLGSATLVNGVDTISLNTSTQNGRQDVSFIDNSTYFGQAWIVGGNGGKTYEIRAIAGNKFVIVSSDTTDTNTVNFQVEGE